MHRGCLYNSLAVPNQLYLDHNLTISSQRFCSYIQTLIFNTDLYTGFNRLIVAFIVKVMGEWSDCMKHPGSEIARFSIVLGASDKSISKILPCL